MPHKVSSKLRIAVLVNTNRKMSVEPSTRQSFITTITAAAPEPEVDFYDPIDDQTYPDVGKYDLVILSGGTADINAPDPWVLKMLDFVRTTVASSNVKLVGICWGHQAINIALGGKLIVMEEGPEASLCRLKGRFNVHEFHRRELAESAPGFVPLAEHNQIFKSPDNRILTFQGHPEMSAKLAQAILAEAPAYTKSFSAEQLSAISERMEMGQDGVAIFERILRWVDEK
ncbi:putative copper iron-regulated glutamine amidotransferase protein [Neofusicoccum parvum UCRNP2]|uniref:Putative copper iron-regulated glutamine amidotransferase protein n=1 Tax=Botryosphaeria parva (strain UCR-NP2) TaxID=1287680 RepID=R1GTY0_BOTPV|nr:putative copper iron-regulated glutamine amidotransferase protein [Neofusicoccum parvum UCRNP2]